MAADELESRQLSGGHESPPDSDDADSFFTVLDEPGEASLPPELQKDRGEIESCPRFPHTESSPIQSRMSPTQPDHNPPRRAPKPIRRSTYPRRPSSRTPEETLAFHNLSCELFSSFDNNPPTQLLRQPQIIHTENGGAYLSTTSFTSPWTASKKESCATLMSNNGTRSLYSRQNSCSTPSYSTHRTQNNYISRGHFTTSARSSIFSAPYGLRTLTPGTPSLASLPSLTYMPSPSRPSSSSSQSPAAVPESLFWMSPGNSSCELGESGLDGSKAGLKGFCRKMLPSRWMRMGTGREKKGPRRKIIID